jgi:hypothetical protein
MSRRGHGLGSLSRSSHSESRTPQTLSTKSTSSLALRSREGPAPQQGRDARERHAASLGLEHGSRGNQLLRLHVGDTDRRIPDAVGGARPPRVNDEIPERRSAGGEPRD